MLQTERFRLSDRALLPGRLIRRYKHFLTNIRLDDGRTITAHCANSGSMLGCAEPGARVFVSVTDSPNRRLPYTWEIVQNDTTWIGINTSVPNRFIDYCISHQKIPEFAGYEVEQREVSYGEKSRIDLLLRHREDGHRCYVEIKNVTLRESDCALFPDSVSQRGTKHLKELQEIVARTDGTRAVMFFVVQRADCREFRPAFHLDALYTASLHEAVSNGVELLCYSVDVRPEGLKLLQWLPIDLEPLPTVH
jgi:sugar fermentation stimulation protein A